MTKPRGLGLGCTVAYLLAVLTFGLAGCTAIAPEVSCSRIYFSSDISALANLVLWLDAQDYSTLFSNSDCTTAQLSGAGSVGCWRDKSAAARHFIQATPAQTPDLAVGTFQSLNALQFVSARFTSLSNASSLYAATGNTVFMVLELPPNDTDRQILDGGTAGGTRRTIGADSVALFFSGPALFFYHSAPPSVNRVLTVIDNGTASSVQDSGNSVPTTGSVGAALGISGTPTVIGSRFSQNNYWINSKVAEIAVVQRVLTGDELLRAQRHLECKYGFID